jgi:hypothetical protein
VTTTSPPDVIQTITGVANVVGLPPSLAVAVAQHESGLNPRAVGDKGTSFGLYQLHQGGELGDLTPEQAFDPLTNARVALTVIANVFKANPHLTPGEVAAKAQRPLDPVGYAKTINALLGAGPITGDGTAQGTTTNAVTDALGNAVNALDPRNVLSAINPFNWGGSIAASVAKPAVELALKGALSIVFVVAALGLMGLGLSRLSNASARDHFDRASQVVGALSTAKGAAALAAL